MAKDTAILVIAVWIKAVFVILAEKREEVIYIFFVDERLIFTCTEELSEVKCLFIICIVAHQRSEVVGIDIDGRQGFIRIGVAHVCQIPFCLSTLLHHIVPSEDFVLCVVVKQIERCP